MSGGVPEISQGGVLAGIDQLRLPALVAAAVQPLHVAAWIEGQTRERSAPTVSSASAPSSSA